MSAEELKETLVAAFPPGVPETWHDEVTTHLGAMASVAQDKAVQLVEDLASATTPLTAPAWRIKEWERAFGLSATRTALFGTLAARQRQVISRWREYGPPTVSMIQSVVAPLLGYANVTDLVVLQSNRTDLRTKHTYPWGRLSSINFSVSTPAVFRFRVLDDAALSPAGAQLDLTVTHGDLAQVGVTIIAPNGDTAIIASLGRGAASAAEMRAYFAAFRTPRVAGLWTAQVTSSSGNGTVHAASLFAEGFGRDGVRNDGLGAAVFQWAVVYEPDKATAGAPDFDAARAAVARITFATRSSGLVFIADPAAGLSPGDYGCIPNDNAVPSACVPGGP